MILTWWHNLHQWYLCYCFLAQLLTFFTISFGFEFRWFASVINECQQKLWDFINGIVTVVICSSSSGSSSISKWQLTKWLFLIIRIIWVHITYLSFSEIYRAMPAHISGGPRHLHFHHVVCMGEIGRSSTLAGEEKINARHRANKSLQSSWDLSNREMWF